MPLDKSRIQGFGSDGPGGGNGSVKVTQCPQGHALKQWTARQGWCDQCGRKVMKGEQVMDCRTCNWYLCDSCCPLEESSSLWDAMTSITNQVGGPAMTSALDSVALQIGDVLTAAQEEMNEMATDVKSFVTTTMGFEDSDEDPPSQEETRQQRQTSDTGTSSQKQEAGKLMSDFCNNYPAARVAPKQDELEALWTKCGSMNSPSLIAAMYEQLSFSSGELEWQPRLRMLYVLEHFHHKGGNWKDMASSVAQQGDGLIVHLTEVQQCKEKASKVFVLLMGKRAAADAGIEVPKEDEAAEQARKAAEAAEAEKQKAAAAAAKKKAAPAPDLLDLAAPAPKAAPAAKAKAKAAAASSSSSSSSAAPLMDLLDTSAPASAAAPAAAASKVPDLDLLLSGPTPAASSASASSAGPSSSSAGLLGGLSLPTSSPAAEAGFDPNAGGAAAGGSGVRPGPAFGSATPAPMGFAALGQAAPYPSMGPLSGGPTGFAALGGGAAAAGAGGPFAPAGAGLQPQAKAKAAGAQGYAAMGGGGGMAGSMAGGGAMPGGMGGAVGGGFGLAGGGGMASLGGKGTAGSSLSVPKGGGGNLPYIAAPNELTPLSSGNSKDPFAFVTQHTGIDNAK